MSLSHRLFCSSRRTLASIAMLYLFLLTGCSNNGDPFSYKKVYGTVTYEDGSLLPVPEMQLSFIAQTEAVGKATPRVGRTIVDGKTGKFDFVTTHTPNDGLIKGKHKVVITAPGQGRLPASILAPEYGEIDQTPVLVDTDHLPFAIKVPKPAK